MKQLLFRTLVIVLVFAVSCAKRNIKPSDNNSPPVLKLYSGTFKWEGENTPQLVEFCFANVTHDKSGMMFSGKGRYNTNQEITTISIRGKIYSGTNYMEIWESESNGSITFVTEGLHRGSISSDLRQINAVWTSRTNNAKGRLELWSAPANEFCPTSLGASTL